MDGGAWWAAVHEVAKTRTQVSDFTFFTYYVLNLYVPLCNIYKIFNLAEGWK